MTQLYATGHWMNANNEPTTNSEENNSTSPLTNEQKDKIATMTCPVGSYLPAKYRGCLLAPNGDIDTYDWANNAPAIYRPSSGTLFLQYQANLQSDVDQDHQPALPFLAALDREGTVISWIPCAPCLETADAAKSSPSSFDVDQETADQMYSAGIADATVCTQRSCLTGGFTYDTYYHA